MGCAGHPLLKTPHLDALAKRGTLFDNAYTPSPMCVPARASIACGDHVHKIRHWDSATPYNGKQRSWMHQLRDQAVPVTSIGKLHFQSEKDDNGFSEEILPMHVVNGVGWAIGLLRDNPPEYTSAAELSADVGMGSSSYTDYDLAITTATEQWLAKSTDQSKPWAAFVSLVSPHYPLTAPDAYYKLYETENVDLPIAYRHQHVNTHPEIKKVSSFFNYDDYFDEQKMREAKVAYFGLTSFMDNCIGRILRALELSGQADNTLVVYTSDHGEMLGDHGLWTKQVMYEASVGVPMIAAGPGIPANARCKTATTLLDIAPTAMDVTGVGHDARSLAQPGCSLRDLANSPDDFSRTVFSEYHDGGSSTGTFMVRWDRWKYVHYVGYPAQLFDLQSDPNELRDLASTACDHPDIAAVLRDGEAKLRLICNPEDVNKQCFSDQRKRIDELGGEEACKNAYVFNHTPAPSK